MSSPRSKGPPAGGFPHDSRGPGAGNPRVGNPRDDNPRIDDHRFDGAGSDEQDFESSRFDRVITEPVMLSYAAYDVLHHDEFGAGTAKPAGLEGVSPGATHRERAAIVEAANAELRQAGLIRGDAPIGALRDTLRLLRTPQRRVYGWYSIRTDAGATRGGFQVAEADDFAVLAAVEQDRVLLEPVEPDALPSTVAGLLPDAPPVDEAPTTMPPPPARHTVPDRDRRSRSDQNESNAPDDERPTRTRSTPPGHRLLERLTAPPLDFALRAVRSQYVSRGTERECEYPLNYYAGPEGALLTVIKRDEDDEPLLHLHPATTEVFLRELRELGRFR
ncbi:ESX secretion-associated protein EspG [Actinopolyspora alba]|uniref:ESX secretion-associated protein EspG n=1 Tax=Actinopolyspora alba TaxID=673379 RepID=UPI00158796AE|nr:ESX secretion-associated protein EspG [Actinopolyspora alba]